MKNEHRLSYNSNYSKVTTTFKKFFDNISGQQGNIRFFNIYHFYRTSPENTNYKKWTTKKFMHMISGSRKVPFLFNTVFITQKPQTDWYCN